MDAESSNQLRKKYLRIGDALDKPFQPPSATRARLHQILQPQIAELFFASRVILVEGREDVAYIKSYLQLNDLWDHLRSLGCHFVPVDKKSELLRPLIIAQEMEIGAFTIFDADGDETHEGRRGQHERDNRSLLFALGLDPEESFPDSVVRSSNATIWPTNLGSEIRGSVSEEQWKSAKDEAAANFDHGASLSKNVMFIAELMTILHRDFVKPAPLANLAQDLLKFADPSAAS